MMMLAKRKDAVFLKKLKGYIGKGGKKWAKDQPTRYVGVLKAAAVYRNKKLCDPLADVVKKYLPTNSEYSVPAIEAYGTVDEKDVVDQMLKWLAQTDSTSGGQGGGSGKSASQQTKDNYRDAKNAIVSTLSDLTGQDIGDATTWNNWWAENKKTFEFPDPDAAPVDITKLREHKDQAYGYTVKLPDRQVVVPKTGEMTEMWKFSEASGCRFQIKGIDDTGFEQCRMEYRIHNLTTKTPKTMGELMKWWVNDWKENQFSEFSETGQPTHEEQKLGGREWLKGKARGQSRVKNWGVCERRVYMTQIGHIVLYIATTVRTGASEQMVKDAYSIVEGTELGKKR